MFLFTRQVRAEWPDWSELIERLQKLKIGAVVAQQLSLWVEAPALPCCLWSAGSQSQRTSQHWSQINIYNHLHCNQHVCLIFYLLFATRLVILSNIFSGRVEFSSSLSSHLFITRPSLTPKARNKATTTANISTMTRTFILQSVCVLSVSCPGTETHLLYINLTSPLSIPQFYAESLYYAHCGQNIIGCTGFRFQMTRPCLTATGNLLCIE